MPPTRTPANGLDRDALKALFKPDGRWARERGACVRERRIELGLTKIEMAERCHVREATIHRVEAGSMVPSEWLKAVMGYTLDCAPEQLWVFPSSLELEIVSRAGAPT